MKEFGRKLTSSSNTIGCKLNRSGMTFGSKISSGIHHHTPAPQNPGGHKSDLERGHYAKEGQATITHLGDNRKSWQRRKNH